MSDDAGTSRPGPRRRTTRRLARHAARSLIDASPMAALVDAPPTAAQADAPPTAALVGAPPTAAQADAPPTAALVDAPPTAAQAALDFDAATASSVTAELAPARKLERPPAISEQVSDAIGSDPIQSVTHGVSVRRAPSASAPPEAWIAESDRPAHGAAAGGDAVVPEVKTKPKIRLPEGASRRHSPRPAASESASTQADFRAAAASGPRVAMPLRAMSPVPPPPVAPPAVRATSSLPPPPDPAGYVPRASMPTGEGIIRASQPAPRPSAGAGQGRPDIDSDVPTRPRIPLTDDMVMAAGRLTSLDMPAVQSDDGADTSPRIILPGADTEAAPAVVVTRARMITGAPPPNDSEPERRRRRPSRRVRPDSEEFETLDLEDGEEDSSRLETVDVDQLVEAQGADVTSRAGRTPPPPPGQPQSKRGAASAHGRHAPPPPPPPPGVAKKPAPVQKTRSGKRRGWWEVLFSDDYVRTLPRPEPALVAKQVGFMEASLGISRGDAVLDVGCGLGQHALEFARRGYLVVALDLALSMITRAAEEAQQHGLRINFLHKDIRDIGFEGTFDAVVCVGTTFGFFDDEQNRGVLQRLAHALKPGGRLLLDVVNRDYVLESQPNLVWFEGDGCVVMEESDFNFYTSRLTVKRTMMREDGRQTESEYSVRLYSVHELGQLLKQAGFGIKEVSGQEATRGLFFGANSSRIIMLAERRASERSPSTPPESDG